MLDLPYSLIIEATEDPNYFGFYSPGLGGFTGAGSSIQECIKSAETGMTEHLELLKENNLSIPVRSENPTILIQNEIKETIL